MKRKKFFPWPKCPSSLSERTGVKNRTGVDSTKECSIRTRPRPNRFEALPLSQLSLPLRLLALPKKCGPGTRGRTVHSEKLRPIDSTKSFE